MKLNKDRESFEPERAVLLSVLVEIEIEPTLSKPRSCFSLWRVLGRSPLIRRPPPPPNRYPQKGTLYRTAYSGPTNRATGTKPPLPPRGSQPESPEGAGPRPSMTVRYGLGVGRWAPRGAVRHAQGTLGAGGIAVAWYEHPPPPP